MKTKLLVVAIASTFALGVTADFLPASHNWNNGSSAPAPVKKASSQLVSLKVCWKLRVFLVMQITAT